MSRRRVSGLCDGPTAPPPHWNPMPMFGLRVRLSRTARSALHLLQCAGDRGIEGERIAPLLYMADLFARQYLGRPITDHEWRKSDLGAASTLRPARRPATEDTT